MPDQPTPQEPLRSFTEPAGTASPIPGRRYLKLAIQVVIMLLVVVGIGRAIRNGLLEIETLQGSLIESEAKLQQQLAEATDPAERTKLQEDLKAVQGQQFSWWSIRWPRLGLAATVYFAGTIPAATFWLASLRRMGQQVSWQTTMKAYYLSQLGKYFPGKALVVILRVGTLHRVGVPAGLATATVFMETLTLMAAGACVATFCFAVTLGAHLLTLVAAGLAVILAAVSSPAMFGAFLKRMKKEVATARIDGPRGYTWAFWMQGMGILVVGWLATGLSLMFVVSALPLPGIASALSYQGILVCTGTASLAMVAGFLSLIPGGAGVRELVITQALAPLIGFAPALAAAVWMRLAWLLAELTVAALFYMIPEKGRDQA